MIEERVSQLIAELQSKNLIIKASATRALGKQNSAYVIESLLKLIEDQQQGDFREPVLGVLHFWGRQRAITPLLTMLQQCPDIEIQQTALRQLGRTADNRAVEALLAFLQPNTPAYLHSVVIMSLGRLRDQRASQPLLAVFDWATQLETLTKAAEALADLSDQRTVLPLLALLQRSNLEPFVHSAIITALGRLGDVRAVEPLLELLPTADVSIRQSAAYALGFIGDERAVEPLIQVLIDENPQIQLAGIYALEQLGDERAVEPLLALLAQETKTRIIGALARALSTLKAVQAVDLLLQHFPQQTGKTLEDIADALGELGDSRALAVLSPLLSSQKASIFHSGLFALAKLGSPLTVPHLIPLLQNPVYGARDNVALLLKQIATPEALAAVAEYEQAKATP